MRKHILLGRGRCINKKNMYDNNKSVSNSKRGRIGTVKEVKHKNKVFKPLKFKYLSI